MGFKEVRLRPALMGFSSVLVTAIVLTDSALVPAQDQTRIGDETKPASKAADRSKPTGPKETKLDFYGDPLPPGALMRLGTLRHRYLNRWWYSHDQFLSDGKTVLTNTDEVRWVDIITGRLIRSWHLAEDYTACGFSPDGRLAMLAESKTAELWDLIAGKRLRILQVEDQLTLQDKGYPLTEIHATFSRDSNTIAATFSMYGRRPSLLRVWDAVSGRELWNLGRLVSDAGWYVAGFLPRGETVVLLNCSTNQVSLRDRNTGREKHSFATMPKHESRLWGLSPDGMTFLMGTSGVCVRCWEVNTGKELAPLKGHKQEAACFAISCDSKIVLTGGGDPFVLVWDWPTAKLRRKIDLPEGKNVDWMHVSANGKRAEVMLGWEKAIRFLDLENGNELSSETKAHSSGVSGLAVDPNGTLITGSGDNTIRIWDLSSGQQLHKYPTKHPKGVTMLALSSDASLIATGQWNDDKIRIHDRNTGRFIRVINTGAKSIEETTFGPQGKLLAVNGYRRDPDDRFLALIDVDTGRELRRFNVLNSNPVFSPDGKHLAGLGRHRDKEDEQLILDVETGQLRQESSFKGGYPMAFSPDGRTLASRTSPAAILWEVATGKERCRIHAPEEGLYFCQFSPDGHWLAVAGVVSIYVFDAFSGRQVHFFGKHDQKLTHLAFSTDGKKLFSSSCDTTVLVWDFAGAVASLPKSQDQTEPKVLETAWNDLASDDAKAAYRAIRIMMEASGLSPAFLRERLQPAPALDANQIERWVTDLDSNQFAKREFATQRLEQVGSAAESALRRMLIQPPSAEARRRGQHILNSLRGPITHPELLRSLRAIEVLESIGNQEAQKVLEMLAKGASQALPTQEAKASLDRLNKRPAVAP